MNEHKIIWGIIEQPKPIHGLQDGSFRYVFEKNRPARIELPTVGLTMNIIEIGGVWHGVTANYSVQLKEDDDYFLCNVSLFDSFIKDVELRLNRIKADKCAIQIKDANKIKKDPLADIPK